jgi:hypothetical protein
MFRHLVHALSGMLALLVCLTALPGRAEAQTGLGTNGILDDPFAFYYAVFLPNQQLQALRPGPLDSVNSAMVARQYYAQSGSRSLYNPISAYSDQAYNPLTPYSQQGQERVARPYRFVQDPSNSSGMGPSLYYNRASQYFPGLAQREGQRLQNANVYTGRQATGTRGGSRAGRMGGMGMGGMGGMGMGSMGMGGMGMGGMGMGGMF